MERRGGEPGWRSGTGADAGAATGAGQNPREPVSSWPSAPVSAPRHPRSPVPEASPVAAFVASHAGLLYFVGAEQGATALISARRAEWVHDGRHLLGFPCH
ncbi:CbtB-domain containing protein [Streptomyces cinnamoneus]|uniref:CbtB-domain containing protein n=1 Tax=Streptomyces cinnamoneus TaxID=53446 RepID=UPI003B9680EF